MQNEAFKSALETRLDKILENEMKAAPTAEGAVLFDRIHSLVMRGGKRARPMLLQLTYKAYGGGDVQELVNLGVALEFHHQFLLIHDDLIDDDTIRYDGPNIVGYYQRDNPGHGEGLPQAMGLLAGDMLFSLSHSVILEDSYLTDDQRIALLKLLNETNLKVAYGEQLDSFNIDPDPAAFSDEKLRLTQTLKTAHYSTSQPMQCAAILLGLSEAERKNIDGFAMPFGVLFQFIDDYSDYFENASAFNNRPKFRDFPEGKVTYPLYYALTHASTADAIYLKTHLGEKDFPPAKMRKVVGILERSGAKEATRKRIESYFAETFQALDTLAIGSAFHRQFMELLESYRI